jgi:LysM repeat protein
MKRILLGVSLCALLVTLGAAPVWAASPPANPIVHFVQWGENLTSIARRYGTTIQAIVRANHIANPSRIYAGQRLIIPGVMPAPSPAPAGGRLYVVRYGDTLSGIAYRFGVSFSAIVRANGIANPNCIYAGQRLLIPCDAPYDPHHEKPYDPHHGAYYVVRRGDTLAKIAWRFGVGIWAIVRANNIANPNVIYVGQRLYIPKAALPVPQPKPIKPTKPGCEHLTWPREGAWLSGVVEAWGTADIEDFGYYKLEFRKDGLDEWHYITGAEDPVEDGSLGTWDTETVSDGTYIFRLVIVDRMGNYPPPCEIAVHVNNDP